MTAPRRLRSPNAQPEGPGQAPRTRCRASRYFKVTQNGRTSRSTEVTGRNIRTKNTGEFCSRSWPGRARPDALARRRPCPAGIRHAGARPVWQLPLSREAQPPPWWAGPRLHAKPRVRPPDLLADPGKAARPLRLSPPRLQSRTGLSAAALFSHGLPRRALDRRDRLARSARRDDPPGRVSSGDRRLPRRHDLGREQDPRIPLVLRQRSQWPVRGLHPLRAPAVPLRQLLDPPRTRGPCPAGLLGGWVRRHEHSAPAS